MALSLSRIQMPFPYRKNPHYEAAAASMHRTLIDAGVIRPHQREYHKGFNLLNAFFFPRVSRSRLLTLSKMIDFFFLCDDIYDTCRANGSDRGLVADLLTTNVDIICGGELPPRPDALNLFAQQVGQEFARLQTPLQQRRLAKSIGDYLLEGSLRLMQYWSRDEIPDIRTYREIRQYDVAMYATIDVSELASGVEIGEEQYHHPIVRRLRREANLQVAMANDILSYHKEVIRDGCPYNMVNVVAHQRGLGADRPEQAPEEAVIEVIEMVNGHTSSFLALERRLPRWGPRIDADVERYVQGMKDLMGGNWYWSLECTRYNSADSPFLELRTTQSLLHEKSKGHLVTEYPKSRARRGLMRTPLPLVLGSKAGVQS